MKGIGPSLAPDERLAALDGLRGLAAVLVVFFHIGWPNHLTNNNFVQNGYLAVDLFFILSGYIIFRNYGTRVDTLRNLSKFICLRLFRVYPLHLAMLAIMVGMDLVKLYVQSGLPTSSEQAPFTNGNSLSALAANVLLVQGLHVLNGPSWNIPSWSISCEFAAYLIFGIAGLAGAFRARLFIPCVGLVAASAYLVLAVACDGLDVTYDWGMARCLAGFSLGAMIVQVSWTINCPRIQLRLRLAAVVTLIAVIGVMSVANGPAVVLVIPLFVVAIALLRTDDGPAARILKHRSIQYLGRISYSIYMVQYITIISVTIVLKRLFKIPLSTDPQTQKLMMVINPWIGDALVLGSLLLVFLISAVTYAWIEVPGRAFGRRLTEDRPLVINPA